MLVTDGDGAIRLVNATFCRWLGVERGAIVGRRFQDLLTMGARIFHQTHWAPLLQIQGSVGEVKIDVATPDGRRIPMMMNAVRRLRGDRYEHELAMFVATDRDTYERELVAARRRAEELLDALGREHAAAEDRALFAEQMVGIVSHDLRNPLATIKLAAELLAKPELAPSQRAHMLANIDRAIDRSKGLIGDLLDFTVARIGRGLAMNLAPIDLHGVVAALVAELRPTYPDRQLVHVRDGEGVCIADASRLYQLVGNLVSNAFSHGDPERPVTVSSTIDAERFALAVHNHGAPIPEAMLGRIFEPMVRGSERSSASRSVGLGLYIVSEIARAHGGRVDVTSGAAGTTFIASFPRTPGPVSAPIPVAATRSD